MIKVGETGLNRLDPRLIELNTGNPYRLDYLAKWKVTNTKIGEKEALRSLAEFKAQPSYGGGREWFVLPPVGGFNEARRLIEEGLRHSGVLDSDKSQNM